MSANNPNEGQSVFPALPAGSIDVAVMVVNGEENEITREWIDDLTNGNQIMFFYGRGQYEDMNGRKYPIRLCYVYDKDSPRLLSICQARYLPREDDPNKDCPGPN